MSEIKKFKPEFIFKYKDEVKLTEKIKKKFFIIMNNMESSTDSKSFKVKISQDIKLNNNKWHRKRFMSDSEKFKKKINSNLNMYSKTTYEKITTDILKLKITSEEHINYLISSIIDKFRGDHNSEVWNYLVDKILYSNVKKWKYNKYVIEKILDEVQNEFDNIINLNYQQILETHFVENIEEFYKIKNRNIGLMKLIAELFKNNLIDKDVITYILEKLTLDIKKNYNLELGIVLVKYIFKYITNEEKVKFIDYLNIFLKDVNLNKKIKFMILDFIEDKNNEVKKVDKLDDTQIETLIKSNINEYKQDSNLEDFLESINDIKVPPKSNKLIYFWILYILENENDFDTSMFLLSSCIFKKIIKYNTLKYGIIEFLNDYNDYKYDYVNIDNIIKKIIKICKKNNFLSYDNLKFIGNKIDSEIKLKLL